MGLTVQSVGNGAINTDIKDKIPRGAKIIALAGNPNVGKSTLFNKLTGMKQHTGNWSGKTVTNAVGEYKNSNIHLAFVDIPGTYSLNAHSAEEEVARDFLVFGKPDLVVVVCDATCLERNLNLVLQVSEICPKVIVCVNLMDEAREKGIFIDLKGLSEKLGLPVVGTSARKGKGLNELISAISTVEDNEYSANSRIKVTYSSTMEKAIDMVKTELDKIITFYNTRWLAIKLLENDVNFIASLEQYLNFAVNKNTSLLNALTVAKNFLNSKGLMSLPLKIIWFRVLY